MPLFRRRKSPDWMRPTSDPDWVAVDEDKLDEWIQKMWERSVDRYVQQEPPSWLDAAQKAGFGNMVIHTLANDDRPSDLTSQDMFAAFTTIRMGSIARSVELEFAGTRERNEALTKFLLYAFDKQSFGEEWYQVICGTAGMLVNASAKGGDDETSRRLLEPTGIGPQARQRFALMAISSALIDHESGQRRGLSLSPKALMHCWLYGYHLAACAASLPDEAHAELADFRKD